MSCNGCTLCCKVLPVPEFNKSAGEHCSDCGYSGCLIHSVRPDICRNFFCCWLRYKWEEDLRPDKCRVVFELVPGCSTYVGTVDFKGHLGKFSRSDSLESWIIGVVNRNRAVVLSNGSQRQVFAPNGVGSNQVLGELKFAYEKWMKQLEGNK